jgi:hypothetical protein
MVLTRTVSTYKNYRTRMGKVLPIPLGRTAVLAAQAGVPRRIVVTGFSAGEGS